jgi:hypothetical protein
MYSVGIRWGGLIMGQEWYDPSMPLVSKLRNIDGRIAANIFAFVDNLQQTGLSKVRAW